MLAKAYYYVFLLILLPSHFNAAPLTSRNPTCFKHTDPLRPNQKVPFPCGDIVTAPTQSNLLDYSVGGAGQFQLMFSCIPSNAPSCAQAKDTFQQAFAILESYLLLKSDIVVNASFLNFCTERGQCGSDGFQILGGAAPANSIQLEDTDGASRMYPQALLKQLAKNSHPKYDPIEIFCEFNAAADFHFPSDSTPMQTTQADMLFVVLHELIHGLGFTSSWDDYINDVPQALTPGITGASNNAGQFQFRGFVENVFDKFMVESATGKPMSARTAALNKIFGDTSTTYQTQDSFLSALQSSQAANVLSTGALKLATTANSLAFVTSDNRTMMLETSLSPYATGSSVSHADFKTFSNTADYLMRFRVDPGVSLQSATKAGGGGPIGPVLLSVLQTLGYATVDNPNPKVPSFETSNAVQSPTQPSLFLSFASLVAYACLPYLQ